MSKKIERPSSNRHIGIYDEDWEFIQHMYGKPGGLRPLGAANVIRAIVHKRVLELKQRLVDMKDQPPQAAKEPRL